MEGVGPADRLPLFIAMVQQAASEKASVPPLQGRVAADPDFGLVPDLIAAADFLSPPATSPSSAPAVLAHLCYGLGRPGLSNTGLWERFYQQQGKTFDDGVVARDTNSFFNFIRAEKVLLEYVELFKVYQNVSMPSAALMEKSARSLPSGYYIVYAADGLVKHCFTSIVRGPSDPAIIYNGYRESDNPPILLEPLTILG
ncbi:hypothetical protein PInf_015511 [Phytophthora infestans]|nr:hypothetical protein PInf_015511 [Phytophthora infestans]